MQQRTGHVPETLRHMQARWGVLFEMFDARTYW